MGLEWNQSLHPVYLQVTNNNLQTDFVWKYFMQLYLRFSMYTFLITSEE